MTKSTPADGPRRRPSTAKRTLTASSLCRAIANVAVSSPVLLRAMVRPGIPPALREKIMLGVASVTGCRYCQWGHTRWAMAKGVSLEEVNRILGQQSEGLEARDPAEAAAILFAQHYAEDLDRFDRASLDNLRLHYSGAQAAEILAYARAVTLGSLTGNTVDAIVARLGLRPRGRGGSSIQTTASPPGRGLE